MTLDVDTLTTVGTTLLSIVVGAAAATFGQFFIAQTQRRNDRRSVAYALAAEIENVLNNSERRGYETSFLGLLGQWRNGKNLDLVINISGLKTELEPVVAANLASKGLLVAEDATNVVRFYSQLMQVNNAIKSLNEGFWPKTEDKIAVVEIELATWLECKTMGRDLVMRLRKY